MPKLNEYTEKTSPDDVDIFLLQDTSATKKITFLSIFNQIKTKLGLGSLAIKNTISHSDLETALLNLINGKLTASGISNDLATTDATKALAAPQGKKLLEFIGTLTALTTTEKTNLVGAVNELVSSVDALNRNLEDVKGSYSYASSNGISTNALFIDINDPFGYQNYAFIVNAGTTTNIPADLAWGLREVLYINPNAIIVRVTGIKMDGSTNVIWTNIYNSGNWTGWREH